MLKEEEKVFDLYENLTELGMNKQQALIIGIWFYKVKEEVMFLRTEIYNIKLWAIFAIALVTLVSIGEAMRIFYYD